jgi:hypothetical protein
MACTHNSLGCWKFMNCPSVTCQEARVKLTCEYSCDHIVGDCYCQWFQEHWGRSSNGFAGVHLSRPNFPQTFLLYAFTSFISCLGKQHLMFKLVFQSLPVAFGIDTAKWICVGSIDVTQLSVAGEYFLNQWMRFVSLHNFWLFSLFSCLNFVYLHMGCDCGISCKDALTLDRSAKKTQFS